MIVFQSFRGALHPASGLDWKVVGSAVWPDYQASIQLTAYDGATVVDDTVTTPTGTYPGTSAFNGGVLLPDGRVFCVPYSATSARIYDPVTDTTTTPTGTYAGATAFYGGVLLANGNVFCVPFGSDNAAIYNPISDTLTFTSENLGTAGSKFRGGIVMKNGKVFCVPSNSTTSRLYGGPTAFDSNVVLSAYYNKF